MKNIVDKNSKPKTSDFVAWVINELEVNPDDFDALYGWEGYLVHTPSLYQFELREGFERVQEPFRLYFGLVDRWRFRRAVNKWKAAKALKDMQNPKPPESEVNNEN